MRCAGASAGRLAACAPSTIPSAYALHASADSNPPQLAERAKAGRGGPRPAIAVADEEWRACAAGIGNPQRIGFPSLNLRPCESHRLVCKLPSSARYRFPFGSRKEPATCRAQSIRQWAFGRSGVCRSNVVTCYRPASCFWQWPRAAPSRHWRRSIP